jgi:hypothetical protein
VRLAAGGAAKPDVMLAGPEDAVVGLLLGRISRAEAESRGVTAIGNVRGLSGFARAGTKVGVGRRSGEPTDVSRVLTIIGPTVITL